MSVCAQPHVFLPLSITIFVHREGESLLDLLLLQGLSKAVVDSLMTKINSHQANSTQNLLFLVSVSLPVKILTS